MAPRTRSLWHEPQVPQDALAATGEPDGAAAVRANTFPLSAAALARAAPAWHRLPARPLRGPRGARSGGLRRRGRGWSAGSRSGGGVAMEPGVEELMPRLLPVGDCDLAEDFDPTVPPRTPQEYLKRVQIEAARCPDVVVAQIDPKKLRKKQTVNISCFLRFPDVSLLLKDTLQLSSGSSSKWPISQPFVRYKMSLNKHRNHWRSQHLDSNVTMPKSEDEEGWKKFCLGERVYSEIDALSDNENLGIDYIKVGFPPLLSIVSRMNQATVTSVLEYLISWFGEKKFTPELGRWLYALLACLEKPLLPEAHSLIRQLARRCSEVRVLEENKNEEQISALNLIICLVSRYFDQRDLADEPS
ncbi:gem-associated protein 2 isoform X2 [Calonectris borealis]|uniref:gem-associated protein 2 isoform X2 n=1 Tax=Calonectris borealis TaxID=1323832 RepID=UPI003F4B9007